MLPILVAVIIFLVAVWLIGILPVPASPFPVKTLLYVLAAVLLILYLIGFV